MGEQPIRRTVDELIANYRDHAAAYEADQDAERLADLEQRAARTRAEAWDRMCPSRFRAVSWEWLGDQHSPEVVDQLASWSSIDPRPNLVLLGPVGTGKTGAGVLVCEADWKRRSRALEFWPTVELLDGLRPDGGLSLDRLMAVPNLLLDDLGSEKATEWAMERIYSLVNRRWLEQRCTIVTSNLEPGPLAEFVGERLFSRLMGDGAVVVRLGGRDRRRGTT